MARLDPEIFRSRPDPDVEQNRTRPEAAGHDPYAALRLVPLNDVVISSSDIYLKMATPGRLHVIN